MPILPYQCRAARALLDWSQADLIKASQVGRSTLAKFESEYSVPNRRLLLDIEAALEEAGVEFIEGGVRLRDKP